LKRGGYESYQEVMNNMQLIELMNGQSQTEHIKLKDSNKIRCLLASNWAYTNMQFKVLNTIGIPLGEVIHGGQ
jgi:hypothetical protein